MPDPNTEHGLRVQLATALRERDLAVRVADGKSAELMEALQRNGVLGLEVMKLRADVKRLREALEREAERYDAMEMPAFAATVRAALATGGHRG